MRGALTGLMTKSWLLRQKAGTLVGPAKHHLTTGVNLEASLIGTNRGFLLLMTMIGLLGVDLVGLVTVAAVALAAEGEEEGVLEMDMTATVAVEAAEGGILEIEMMAIGVVPGGEGVGATEVEVMVVTGVVMRKKRGTRGLMRQRRVPLVGTEGRAETGEVQVRKRRGRVEGKAAVVVGRRV